MSIAQKEALKSAFDWAVKITIGMLAWLAVTTFNSVRSDIKDLSQEVKGVKSDVQSVRERVIRIETKIESNE